MSNSENLPVQILLIDIHFRREVIPLADVDAYVFKTLDSSFKGVVFNYYSIVSYKNFINRENFTLNILNEAFLTNQIVFYFSKNFYLVEKFNSKISQFKSIGLINFWMSQYTSSHELKSKTMKYVQTSLRIIHLEGVFLLLIYGLSFATIVFVIEIILQIFIKILKML